MKRGEERGCGRERERGGVRSNGGAELMYAGRWRSEAAARLAGFTTHQIVQKFCCRGGIRLNLIVRALPGARASAREQAFEYEGG